jgi:tyrosyl-tRNA synthetase
MNPQEQYDLISHRISPDDIVGKSYLMEKLQAGKQIKGYVGFAPTGRCHIGYVSLLLRVAQCLDAGCEIIILLADVHAFLDARKSGLEDEARTEYYKQMITELLRLLNADLTKVKFVKGSEYQYSKPYIQDLLRLLNTISISKAKHAGAEVVKQAEDPLLSSLVYPLMQSLDETHLDPDLDFELAGIDQRKLFMFSVDYVNKSKNKKMTYIMNQLVPGLSKESLRDPETKVVTSQKMSSSDSAGKLDLLDTPKEILNKLKKAYCLEGDAEDNTVLVMCKHIIFPVLERLHKQFVIFRDEKYGGNLVINSHDELYALFADKSIHPSDLKKSVANIIADLFEPIRHHFSTNDMVKLLEQAYGK